VHEGHEGFEFLLFKNFVTLVLSVVTLFSFLFAPFALLPQRLRRARKLSGIWNIRTQGIDSRQGAKHAKFGGKM
jgi:hypothetical protein